MIIVEGPDGSGKSTLAKKLGRVHHTGGQSLTLKELMGRVKKIEEQDSSDLVIDRFPYLSEIVYRQPPLIAHPETLLSMFEVFREKYDIRLIYCRTNIQTMMENISTEEKAHKTPEYLEHIKSRYINIVYAYDALFAHIEPDLVYDWQKDDLPCVD